MLNDKRIDALEEEVETLKGLLRQKDMRIIALEEENSHLQWVCLNTLKKIKMKGKVKKGCGEVKKETSTD